MNAKEIIADILSAIYTGPRDLDDRTADYILARLAAHGLSYEDGVKAERERCRRIAKGAWLTAPYGEIADADAMCALSEHIEALILAQPAAPTTGGDA